MFSMRMGMGLGMRPSGTVTGTLFTASGGQVVEIGDYRYHIFDYGTDTLSISAGSADIDYMLIGGGASGGSGQTAGVAGGGGGAGGIVSGTLTAADSDITLSVGAGGVAKTGHNEGNPGNDTTLTIGETTLTAKGGGGGGVGSKAGLPGGSGGGAGGRGVGDPGTTGGAALQTTPATEGYDAGYGNAGGNRVATYIAANGAGGGGAGGAGGNCSTELGAGAGGAAKAMADFDSVLTWHAFDTYAAGGSGGTAGASGLGGLSATAHGLNGTGSGGGGSRSNQPGTGNGGSGIAILRYAKDGATDAEYQNVRLYIDGDGYLWVRSQFDSSYDSLLKYDTGPSVGVLPYYEYLIPITNPPLDFTTGAVAAKTSGDDAAPVGIAGTSTGTGHGAQIVTLMVKAAGHGLVAADIGSVWEDSAEAEFVLCAIKSATEASFIAKAYSGTELWNVATATASSLKLTCGVASVTFDSQSCVYMAESASGILAYTTPAKTWQLADGTDIEAETLYRCSSASFRTVTQHINPISFREWCKANAGTFGENPTQAQIDAVDITKILEIDYCYQFRDHGSVEITNKVKFLQAATGGRTMGVGAAAIAGSTLKFYAPGIKDSVTGFNRAIKTYALANDWTLSTTVDLVDSAEPINRIVMLCDDATKYCYSHGIDTTYGEGTAKARLAGNLDCWWGVVKATLKSLGRITVNSSKNVNDTVQYRVYRKLFKPGGYGTASFVYWVVMGGYYYIYIDYHATADENITLPAYLFGGKTYTIHEQQGTWTTPATGGTIGADGTLAVNVTDWGHTILKVSAT